jgi:hypothetical protein
MTSSHTRVFINHPPLSTPWHFPYPLWHFPLPLGTFTPPSFCASSRISTRPSTPREQRVVPTRSPRAASRGLRPLLILSCASTASGLVYSPMLEEEDRPVRTIPSSSRLVDSRPPRRRGGAGWLCLPTRRGKARTRSVPGWTPSWRANRVGPPDRVRTSQGSEDAQGCRTVIDYEGVSGYA